MGYKLMRFPNGKTKAVTFSYDDAVKADIRLVEIFDKYGLKGTFNINSNYIGALPNKLTVEEIKREIIDKGHEIATHGASHFAPGMVTTIEGIRDSLNCRLGLEEMFGIIVRGMAYPDTGIRKFVLGEGVEKVKQYLGDLGIAYARTLGGDNDGFALPESWLEWMPSAHHNNPNLPDMIDKFNSLDLTVGTASHRSARLLYIWGHSYEFDKDNNWDMMENICQRISGREDIWYATNIEIYDYITAFKSLVWSADTKLVYNPTLYKIWFFENDNNYIIEPGQTLRLK